MSPTDSRIIEIPSSLKSLFIKNKTNNSKYTSLNFLPKNVYNQFKQHMNKYFLLIASLQTISVISPVNPLSTWLPLLIILALSTIKELVEHLNIVSRDKEINLKIRTVFRSAGINDKSVFQKVSISTESIRVGDLVELQENEDIPCDMILLYSSKTDGTCYLSTANLDGETNFKPRRIARASDSRFPNPLSFIQDKNAKQMLKFHIKKIECEMPNDILNEFTGKLFYNSNSSDSDENKNDDYLRVQKSSFLQSTCVIKNVKKIIGVVTYTGRETKFGMGHSESSFKLTSVEAKTNKLIITLFITQLFCAVIFGSIGIYLNSNRNPNGSSLLPPSINVSFKNIMIYLARFLLLLSSVIPISLKVCLDAFKLLHSKFISYDPILGKNENRVITNNTSIPEELGQIQFILSDKTGTLTRNEMFLKFIHVNNKYYNIFKSHPSRKSIKDLNNTIINQKDDENLIFLFNIAVNNTVFLEDSNTGRIDYTSPDELALIEGLNKLNINLISKTEVNMKFKMDNGIIYCFKILETIEFTSERKCMSVVAKEVNSGQVYLFCKGADEVMLSKYKKVDLVSSVIKPVEKFASSGLRTLCFGYKKLGTDDDVNSILKRLFESKSNNLNYTKVCQELESQLCVSGVVGIEDTLDNNVQDTISSLSKANIKFWMITGDKFSTAKQIAHNCGMTTGQVIDINIDEQILKEKKIPILETVGDLIESFYEAYFIRTPKHSSFTLMISSSVAEIAMSNFKVKFEKLCLRADFVIFSRVSPKMKAELVKLVRSNGYRVLAIGDGGNDVGMIQAANVGIGIRGKEGRQAANSADFQIQRFSVLKHLLLFHGLTCYRRSCRIILLSFYKSVYFCFMHLFFSFYSQFSGSSYFDTMTITLYNMTMFFPILFMSFDLEIKRKDIDTKGCNKYKNSKEGKSFRKITFTGWCIRGLAHAAITVSLAMYMFKYELSMYEMGYFAFISYLGTIITTIFVECRTISVLQSSCSVLMVIVTICLLFMFTEIPTLANHRNFLSLASVTSKLQCYFGILMIISINIGLGEIYTRIVWNVSKG